MTNKVIINDKIIGYYKPIIRGIELISSGDFNSLFVVSKPGLGKSSIIDAIIQKEKIENVVVFSGDLSEVKFFEFLYENKNKIIIIRDFAKLLRNLSSIEILKALTENKKVRIIERRVKGNEIKIAFTGKFIFEMNDISKKFKKDLEALFTRGLYINLNLSIHNIKDIMFQICQNTQDKIITKYLINKSNLIGHKLSLRLQDKCFRIYKASIRDKRDWKKDIQMYLNTQVPESRELLYMCADNKPIKRMEFAKFLMREKGYSLVTAQRRIKEFIFLGEIYSNGLEKQACLSLQKPILVDIKNGKVV